MHGFEPTPELFKNLPTLPRVTFHQMAVADKEGVLKFHVGSSLWSSVRFDHTATDSIEVKAACLETFCTQNGIAEIELLKMDIEGEEIPVLLGASDAFLRSIHQLTVEFHEVLHPDDVPTVKRIVQRLEGLGFTMVKGTYRDFADVLFINEAFHHVSAWNKFSMGVVARYRRGVARYLNRKLKRGSDWEP